MIDEGYDVKVFRSAKAVAAFVVRSDLCLDNEVDDPVAASEADIIRKINKEKITRLFPIEGGDWQYRIEKHNKAQG